MKYVCRCFTKYVMLLRTDNNNSTKVNDIYMWTADLFPTMFVLSLLVFVMCRLGKVWRGIDGRGADSSGTNPVAVRSHTCQQRRYVCCRRFIDNNDSRKWRQLGRLWQQCHKQRHRRQVVKGRRLCLGRFYQFWICTVGILFNQVIAAVW